MRGAERIELALVAFRKTGDALPHAQPIHRLAPPGQHLVPVGLMADVPYQAVVRGVEYVMQRNRQLDSAEVRRQMAAGLADRIDQKFAQFLRQPRQIAPVELAQIGR